MIDVDEICDVGSIGLGMFAFLSVVTLMVTVEESGS